MSSKGRVEWASLEPSEGVSSNLWRNELDDHVFIVQRHVLRSAKHRIVLKLPRQPLVCSVDSKEAALSVEALLVTLYTAEALRVGAYRFSDAHLRRFLLRQLSRLRRVTRTISRRIRIRALYSNSNCINQRSRGARRSVHAVRRWSTVYCEMCRISATFYRWSTRAVRAMSTRCSGC